jgi:hypothetical protein
VAGQQLKLGTEMSGGVTELELLRDINRIVAQPKTYYKGTQKQLFRGTRYKVRGKGMSGTEMEYEMTLFISASSFLPHHLHVQQYPLHENNNTIYHSTCRRYLQIWF